MKKATGIRKALMTMALVVGTLFAANNMTETAQAAHAHTFKVVSVKKATYKKAGYEKLKCTSCKKTKKVKVAKLKCTEHHFVAYKTKKATEKKAGWAKEKCTNCGKKRKVTLPKVTKQVLSVNTDNQPKTAGAETTATASNTTANTTEVTNENVSGMYGNGQDVTFTMNGKTVTGHYDAKASMELVQLLNNYRQGKGLKALATTKALTSAAMTRSQEITVVFDHTRPNGSKWSTVSSVISGENIAAGYTSAQAIMNGWINSPSHNANMLNTSFKKIGISVFAVKTPYGFYTYYAAQSFGR